MKKDHKYVIYWLLLGCLLIFVMVVIGGITRLTHSGLSISNYKLISGVLPPMNADQWQAAFELYKQYPEYQKLNNHFSLADFKSIYFWEWLHRLIGRLIGLVFLLPFFYFIIKKQLRKSTFKKALMLMVLGGFQGFLGWYMVKSGLVNNPDVSHYRLAAHLITAFVTFGYTLWVALDLMFPDRRSVNKSFRNLLRLTLALLLVQILYGAFVAGLDAGFIHNHWPMMSEGKFMHKTVYLEKTPLYKNFIEGKSGVQFVHRVLAFFVLFSIIALWLKSRRLSCTFLQAKALQAMVLLVGVQFLLGVFTILFQVPIILGILHQIGAFFLLSAVIFTLHRFSK